MHRLAKLVRSSIGSKFLMALTGLLMLGFVIGHLSGNLLIFQGRDAINSYSEWLHDHPGLVWATRLGLLAALVVHVATAARLARANLAARPQPYAKKEFVEATWASRQMVLTGVLVLVYVLYHLAHLTFRVVPTADVHATELVVAAGTSHERADVYAMLVGGFRSPLVAASYVLAQIVLGLHLIHGIGSMFQTFGWNHAAFRPIGAFLGFVLPVAIVLGYCAIPLAVLSGVVH